MQSESHNPPYLSIVIPAYNEDHRIGASLEVVGCYLEDQPYTYEVLVVDDGSTDRTRDICREFEKDHPWFRLVKSPQNRGKGHAVRQGVLQSRGEHVLMCDADLATPIEEIEGFWQYVENGADIVIASRPLRESHLVKRQPFYREMAGRLFNFFVQSLAVPGIHDTQCGFKLFRRDAAQSIFSRCTLDGFSFDIEVLYIARRMGFRIYEEPVHWYHRDGSKVSFLRDGSRMLVDLLKVRSRHRNLGEMAGS